jgi:hypothetical protein
MKWLLSAGLAVLSVQPAFSGAWEQAYQAGGGETIIPAVRFQVPVPEAAVFEDPVMKGSTYLCRSVKKSGDAELLACREQGSDTDSRWCAVAKNRETACFSKPVSFELSPVKSAEPLLGETAACTAAPTGERICSTIPGAQVKWASIYCSLFPRRCNQLV